MLGSSLVNPTLDRPAMGLQWDITACVLVALTGGTIHDMKRPFSLHYHLPAALWPNLQTEVGTSTALAVLRVPAALTALAHVKGPDLVLVCFPPVPLLTHRGDAQPSHHSCHICRREKQDALDEGIVNASQAVSP